MKVAIVHLQSKKKLNTFTEGALAIYCVRNTVPVIDGKNSDLTLDEVLGLYSLRLSPHPE